MKSIGQIDYEAYFQDDCGNLPRPWHEYTDDADRYQRGAKAVLAYAASIIRERAETETKTWAARDEWLRVADLLESLE